LPYITLSKTRWIFLPSCSYPADEARYIFSRLLLRKPKWNSLATLQNYTKELGEEGLETGVKDLCRFFGAPQVDDNDNDNEDDPMDQLGMDSDEPPPKAKGKGKASEVEDGPEVIDLTLDSDDEGDHNGADHVDNIPINLITQSSHCSDDPEDPDLSDRGADETRDPGSDDFPDGISSQERDQELDLSHFCLGDEWMTLEEALMRLKVDQLKWVVKQTKTKCTRSNPKVRICYCYPIASVGAVLYPSSSVNARAMLWFLYGFVSLSGRKTTWSPPSSAKPGYSQHSAFLLLIGKAKREQIRRDNCCLVRRGIIVWSGD
jgi:hypothetical protein